MYKKNPKGLEPGLEPGFERLAELTYSQFSRLIKGFEERYQNKRNSQRS